MSSTKSPSLKAPATNMDAVTQPPYWSLRRLSAWFFIFVWGAVAINLYFLGLMWQALGWAHIAPVPSILIAFPLAFPATWASARWIRGLMDEAEADD